MLRGASVQLWHNPLPTAVHAHLDALVAAGCEGVAICPHSYCSLKPNTPAASAPPRTQDIPWWIWPDVGQDPDHPYQNSPHPQLVELACWAARRRGLTVWLKPHIDSYQATWRGYISVKDVYQHPPRWNVEDDWRYAYRERFLRGWAAMAQRTGVGLCLGCELGSVTHELGAGFWVELAHNLRTWGFTGPLTYAANWGAETLALEALWTDPAITAVGCDWYAPAAEADAAQADLLTLLAHVNKPLILMEIGFSSVAGPIAAQQPWYDPQPGDVPDYAQQAALVGAARARWTPHAQAAYWWEAGGLGVPEQPVSHQLLGRPAGAAAWEP